MKNKKMNRNDTLERITEIKKKIDAARYIAIFSHVNIDGDAVGSMIGLYEFLESKNKNVSMFCDQEEIPEFYKFIDSTEKINNKRFAKYDLLIAVDSASIDRLGKYSDIFANHKNTINIDHHISNNKYAKTNLILPYSSCGEIIFEIFKELNEKISEKIATALFMAISADTCNFTTINLEAKSYLIAGELASLGADINEINLHLHKYKTLPQLRLAGYMASNLQYKKGVAYVFLSEKILRKLKVSAEEVPRFISLVNDLKNAQITLIIKEIEKSKFKISLRSVKNVDVSKVAETFGGGGHKNASACIIEGKPKTTLKNLLKECYKEIDRTSRS